MLWVALSSLLWMGRYLVASWAPARVWGLWVWERLTLLPVADSVPSPLW